ncbi:SGNH/GDSL hydrolase family protein [Nocardioides nitrophenolicus]|uniref:SGNH/GDSL hydrolase family protein n=1 Tax=Nocardioides nitrophenolicus TaxID=60489 RepID=UPI0019589C5F|nr:SGNH/GDSL hydrolase family protein [Nocardioides nitrophenolicus]MBM7519490.1 lysophospholipase L1-like esterase [Nocardioides nitrophenolicus]
MIRPVVGRCLATLVLVLVAWGLVVAVREPAPVQVGATGPTARPGAYVLALGDSVPAGNACDCEPYPVRYGELLGTATHTRVTVDNRAVGGSDSADLLDELDDPDLRAVVRRADIVLLTIGANDFGDQHDDIVGGRCSPDEADCVGDELTALRERLTAALGTIRALRGARPTTVLVTGYWNVFEDGDVAREDYGPEGLSAARALTRRANAVIHTVSDAAGARYVDLAAAFRDAGSDPTELLADDGDHPNAAGHDLIARALLAAGTVTDGSPPRSAPASAAPAGAG